MKKVSREIEIQLTPEQEPVWEQALAKFIRTSKTIREYYDPPISPPANGKVTMPYDPDMILEMNTLLKQVDNANSKIANEISQQLTRVYAREKML
jgi:hypothetical protein